MTLPPHIRIFFGIALDEEITKQLSDYIKALKKASRSYQIRWSKPENLHITLQFLDNFKPEDLPKLLQNVRLRLHLMQATPTFSLTSLHFYPSPFHPRVVVLDVSPQKELEQISKVIAEGIIASSYPTDSRDYRAHVTLGRIKQPHDISLQFLHNERLPLFKPISIGEVVLFRSEPQLCGSSYTILERLPLTV